MNLLPKSHQEFSKADYWNTFFKKRGQKAFEWYGEFPELSTYLLKYIKPRDEILIVGCGNSSLGMDLYDAGYKNTNIDISPVVVKQMQEMNKVKRPDLVFEQMDATKMTFENEKFSVILDKGTLDALMTDNDEATVVLINKYHNEIKRVLRNSGRYICISLLQEHILRTLLKNFSSQYAFRIIRCHDVEFKAREKDESPLPTFFVVSTKFTKLPQPILEMALTDGPPVRLSNADEVLSNVISTQESASLCNSLQKGSVANDGEVSLDLYRPGDKEPRYTIYILDQLNAKESKSYAAFIVPQGRELDWIFNSKEGRQELLKSTQPYDRLAIVTLRRGQKFENLDSVKSELADSILNFAPSKLSQSQIPFLSLGSDIGERKICYEGKSELSGPFVVEEVTREGDSYRRLVFLNNQFVVQSEAKLKQVTSRRKKTKLIVDPNFVACNHHLYMSVGLKTVFKDKEFGETIIVGLGGGGLCTFIRRHIPQTKITAVEIDQAILKVAIDYFDLKLDEKLKVEIADGIEYLKNSSLHKKKYTAILFDADNKDTSLGMNCPPKEFVESSFLKEVKSCLSEDGFFIMNLLARNKKLRDDVVEDLKNIYEFVATYKMSEEVNEVVFCSNKKIDFEEWIKLVQESASSLNTQAKSDGSSSEDLIEMESLLSNIKIAS